MDWLTKPRFTIDYYKAKERCIEEFCAQKIPEIIVQYPSIDAEKLSNWATDFARAYFDMLDERCKKTDKIRKYAFSRVETQNTKIGFDSSWNNLATFYYYRLAATNSFAFECDTYQGRIYLSADDEDLLNLNHDEATLVMGSTISRFMEIGKGRDKYWAYITTRSYLPDEARFTGLTR